MRCKRLCRAQPGGRHQWRTDGGAISNLHQFDIVFSHSIGQDATDLGHKLSPQRQCAQASVRGAHSRRCDLDRDQDQAAGLHRNRHGDLGCSLPDAGRPLSSPISPPAPNMASPSPSWADPHVCAVILVGTEISYGLPMGRRTDRKLGARWATTLLSKSVLAEQGDGWSAYDPPHSHAAVKMRSSRPICW
jgi:hypothetical protein